jgi:UDP-N-acetylmuramyl pentapeptide phosphotransferase/UDP-N-acetylglucosamine-1-phosphate transferase
MMSTPKDRLRIGGALALILLGGIVLFVYSGEEFSFVIGLASMGVGLGFLWHVRDKKRKGSTE